MRRFLRPLFYLAVVLVPPFGFSYVMFQLNRIHMLMALQGQILASDFKGILERDKVDRAKILKDIRKELKDGSDAPRA